MNYWTTQRKASFFVHAYFVAVPFGLSTGAALAFWHAMFGQWMIAILMVSAIEILSLTGLALYILRIPSPFVALRHLLPFISIVPLGRELYILLAHNGWEIASALTVVAVSILVVIAWQCFRTIERLFIPADEAAREKAREQVGTFTRHLAQLEEMNNIVDGFVVDRMHYHAPSMTAARIANQEPVAFGSTQVQTETTKAIAVRAYECPKCGSELSLGAYGAAVRHGTCKACKETTR